LAAFTSNITAFYPCHDLILEIYKYGSIKRTFFYRVRLQLPFLTSYASYQKFCALEVIFERFAMHDFTTAGGSESFAAALRVFSLGMD